MCQQGGSCSRPLCFFAHSLEQLRFPDSQFPDDPNGLGAAVPISTASTIMPPAHQVQPPSQLTYQEQLAGLGATHHQPPPTKQQQQQQQRLQSLFADTASALYQQQLGLNAVQQQSFQQHQRQQQLQMMQPQGLPPTATQPNYDGLSFNGGRSSLSDQISLMTALLGGGANSNLLSTPRNGLNHSLTGPVQHHQQQQMHSGRASLPEDCKPESQQQGVLANWQHAVSMANFGGVSSPQPTSPANNMQAAPGITVPGVLSGPAMTSPASYSPTSTVSSLWEACSLQAAGVHALLPDMLLAQNQQSAVSSALSPTSRQVPGPAAHVHPHANTGQGTCHAAVCKPDINLHMQMQQMHINSRCSLDIPADAHHLALGRSAMTARHPAGLSHAAVISRSRISPDSLAPDTDPEIQLRPPTTVELERLVLSMAASQT